MVRFLLLFLILAAPQAFAGSNQNLVYQGRLTKPDGQLMDSGLVEFSLSIRSPSPQDCVLFSETHSVNMTGSQGVFSLEVGSGTRTDGGSHHFRKVFVNGETLSGLTCGNGETSYVSTATDDRNFVLTFNDGSSTISFAPVPIKSVPFALQAKEVDGWGINNLVKVSNLASPTTFTFAELEIAKTIAALTCANNEVLKWNGTTWTCGTDSSGGAGPGDADYGTKGLVGFNSNASTSGIMISGGIASLNTGTGANQIVKLDGSGKLPGLDGSALMNLNAAQISSGNLSMPGNISTTGVGSITSSGSIIANSGVASTSPSNGSLTVVGGTGISGALNVGSNIETAGDFISSAPLAATSTAHQSSPSIYLRANYWNGFSSATDQWRIQNILGAGSNPSSTLTFGHLGSSGSAAYAFLNGKVGIGTSVPDSTLDVVGDLRVQSGQAYNPIQVSSAATPLTFDTALGNNLRWSAGATVNPVVNIHHMKPGGSYVLVVQGTGTGPVTINCYADAGVTTLPNSFLPANGNRLAGSLNKTIYDILSDGENCMISWSSGY